MATQVWASSVVESPMTEMALPLTVIGADRSRAAWVPPRIESSPLVCAVPASDPADAAGAPDAAAGSAGATTVAASLDELSPMTEIALPPIVTGAETSMSACVPDPMPSSPEVTATGSGVAAAASRPPSRHPTTANPR